MEFNFKENMDAMFEKFETFLKDKTIIGEPIQLGEITMIPAVSVSFGMANAGGNGNDPKGTGGTGSAGGFGAKITPTAMLVIKDGEVTVYPINKGNAFEKLVEMVPEIVEKIDMKNKSNSTFSEDA